MVALLAGILAAGICAVLAVLALSFTGWHLEDESPAARFGQDLPFIVVAGGAAALGGVALVTALFGDRRAAVWVGVALGTSPVLVHAAAYFTERL